MRRRAFILGDVLVGLGLVVLLMSLLAVAIKSRQDGAFRLADRRASMRLAEQVKRYTTPTRGQMLDFYGRKFRFLNIDNKNMDYNDIL